MAERQRAGVEKERSNRPGLKFKFRQLPEVIGGQNSNIRNKMKTELVSYLYLSLSIYLSLSLSFWWADFEAAATSGLSRGSPFFLSPSREERKFETLVRALRRVERVRKRASFFV